MVNKQQHRYIGMHKKAIIIRVVNGLAFSMVMVFEDFFLILFLGQFTKWNKILRCSHQPSHRRSATGRVLSKLQNLCHWTWWMAPPWYIKNSMYVSFFYQISAILPIFLPFRHSAIPAIIFVAACGGVTSTAWLRSLRLCRLHTYGFRTLFQKNNKQLLTDSRAGDPIGVEGN